MQTLLQKLSHEMIGLDASFVAALDKGETGRFKIMCENCIAVSLCVTLFPVTPGLLGIG